MPGNDRSYVCLYQVKRNTKLFLALLKLQFDILSLYLELQLNLKSSIRIYSLESKLPKSNAKLPKANEGDIVTLVNVDISKYKRRHEKKVVRKTLTIPDYLNEEAKEAHINFSALLSDAIRNKLGIN